MTREALTTFARWWVPEGRMGLCSLGARHSSDASCFVKDEDARLESRAPSAPPSPRLRGEKA
jgi:hypothetical protein